MKMIDLRRVVIGTIALLIIAVQIVAAQKIEIVAEIDVTPGNVAVSKDGRIFMTVHPLRKSNVQLVEIVNKNTLVPFPNASWNKAPGSGYDVINTPLGMVVDANNVLWVIDVGNMVKEPFQPKLLAFQVETGELVYRYDFPSNVAAKGTFVQDLVVDTENKFVYLADIGVGKFNPAIVVLDYANNISRRFEAAPSLKAENVEMIIDGESQIFQGKPLRVGINPIHLSADNETIFYGAMSGKTIYKLPAKLFRSGAPDAEIVENIKKFGNKTPSDGGTIDQKGNIYFTNVGNHSIDRLTPDGKIEVIAKDDKLLQFPDNIRFGSDGYIYVAVNQLNKTPAWTSDKKDNGKPPYYIVRIKVNEVGVWGR
ncbi:MAG: hypothetical protein IAF08_00045 [Rhizobacter sp.]|nr:hypothetical protein [Chlorobiales bacterium]